MLPKPISVTAIDLIEAQDLNDLVAFYNELWNDPSTGPFTYPTHNDTTGNNLDRRYGWGQVAATINPTPIASTSLNNYNGTVVTLSDINQITAQINAGGYHKEDNPIIGGLLALTGANTLSVGDKIPTSLYNSVCTLADNLFTDQYKTDFLNLSTSEVTSVNTSSWTDDLAVVHKFVFADYNEARHFFNSGGEFTLELSMANGGNSYNQLWQDIFDQFDSIRIGAEECRIVTDDDNGETQYDVISTSGVNKGFYTGIIYSSTPDFNTILDAGVFRYGSGGGYAYVYEYSEYNSRRIRIQIKADEVGGTFNIYVRVILIEDVDDISPITQNITLESGYAQPSTVPVTSPPDLGVPYATVGSTVYQFIERAAPTIEEWYVDEANPSILGWQSVDVTSGTNLPPVFATKTYSLSTNSAAIDEGQTFTITLTTTNVTSGTIIPYTITGVTSADIDNASLTGNFVVGTTNSITFTVTSDATTEGNETFNLALNNGKDDIDVTITDTSLTPSPATYALTVDSTTVNEGTQFTVTLTTTNVSDNTNVPYTITGVTSADIDNASLTGNLAVSGNQAILTVDVTADTTNQEGNETFNLALDNGKDDIDVTITDSSIAMYELQDIFADTYKNTSITNTQIQTSINMLNTIRETAVAQSISPALYKTLVTAFITDDVDTFIAAFYSLNSTQQTAVSISIVPLINNDHELMNTNGNNTNYGQNYRTDYSSDMTGLAEWGTFAIAHAVAYDADMLAFSNELYNLTTANLAILDKIDDRNVFISPTTPVSSNDWYPQ